MKIIYSIADRNDIDLLLNGLSVDKNSVISALAHLNKKSQEYPADFTYQDVGRKSEATKNSNRLIKSKRNRQNLYSVIRRSIIEYIKIGGDVYALSDGFHIGDAALLRRVEVASSSSLKLLGVRKIRRNVVGKIIAEMLGDGEVVEVRNEFSGTKRMPSSGGRVLGKGSLGRSGHKVFLKIVDNKKNY